MKQYVLVLASLAVAASCNGKITGLEPPSDPATETFAATLGVDLAQMTRLPNGVYYKDLAAGTGLEVTDSAVSVNVTYAAYLKDGKLVDSGTNTSFVLSGVIPGVRSGLIGMKEGGKRKVVIPSALGYGGRSQRDNDGKILVPRQSTLVFDLEVVKVVNPTPAATTLIQPS
jgi:FKBP-type peptidyl-prolyl cis-trans isomerase FkpA